MADKTPDKGFWGRYASPAWEVAKQMGPYIMAAFGVFATWLFGLDPVPVPWWVLVLIGSVLVIGAVFLWRAYRPSLKYDDNDIIAILIDWFGKQSYGNKAIHYSQLDRQFRFPAGSTERLIDKAAAHFRYFPTSKGKNVARYEQLPYR